MQLNFDFRKSLVKRISDIGHKGKRRDSEISLHRHASYGHEMIYVDYGKVHMRIDSKNIFIKSGECVFIPGGANHSFAGEAGTHFDYLNIMFQGKLPDEIFRKSLPVNSNCHGLMERLKQESIQAIPHCKELIACYLTELIIHLLRQLTVALPGKPLDPMYRQRYRSEIVNKALSVIADSYSSPLGLKQLAKAVGISESHLHFLLKKETGKNFSLILQEHRVAAAKHLLLDSTFPIQGIANAVGYSTQPFFFKIFKRATGMTPKAYSGSLGDPMDTR
ncbi:MAG: helix-turn-helix domain-containing protein [Lentisphaerota bacterium]